MFNSNKFYDVVKIRDHKTNKNKILDKIDSYEEHSFNDISHTDWTGNPMLQRQFRWFSFCFSKRDIETISMTIYKKYQRRCKVKNAWFNQYYSGTGSQHQVHDHPDSDLVLIYYVELKNRNLATNIYHPISGDKIIPRVKEGRALLMPSNILHNSPVSHFHLFDLRYSRTSARTSISS